MIETQDMSTSPQNTPHKQDLPQQLHSIEICDPAPETVNNDVIETLPKILQDVSVETSTITVTQVQVSADLEVENVRRIETRELNGDSGFNLDQPVEVINTEIPLTDDDKTIVEAQPIEVGIEVEYDSSPYQSSSEETSSDDSEDSDDDYELLDPAEQARRLMEGDGSDDEGGKVSNVGQLRTANEKIEEVIDIPKIEGILELKIEELGNVEAKVENLVLIKAKISGEYQVLESGSVLCLQDHTVIGAVSETLGRVQEPLYCVRFTNVDTISGFGLERGTTIYYVQKHSTFVFTKALQSVKGSDASNIHDEEIGGDEIEFSDDEAEAEYKRQKKLQKQERKGLRGGLTRGRGDFSRPIDRNAEPQIPSTLSYDDTTMDDELYTPLSRPSNLNLPGRPTQMDNSEGFSSGAGGMRGRGNRGRGGSRGRGDRRNQQGERQSQAYDNGLATYGSQSQYQQQHQQVYPSTGSSYPQGQPQNVYTQQQQFHQPMQYQYQSVQHPNQFHQYQQNQQAQFAGQSGQYAQQYPQQVFPQAVQWPAIQQAVTNHNLAHYQGASQGTVPQFGALNFMPTAAYFNPTNQFTGQFQKQSQPSPPPPPPPPPS